MLTISQEMIPSEIHTHSSNRMKTKLYCRNRSKVKGKKSSPLADIYMIVHFPGVSIIPLSTIFEWIWELFLQSGILFPFYRVFLPFYDHISLNTVNSLVFVQYQFSLSFLVPPSNEIQCSAKGIYSKRRN